MAKNHRPATNKLAIKIDPRNPIGPEAEHFLKPKTHLYLVRHGQYIMDRDSDRYGHLTTLGQRQARWVGQRLRDYPIDRTVFSTMIRARETAAEIFKTLKGKPQSGTRLLWEGMPVISKELSKQLSAYTPQEVAADRKRMNLAYTKYFRPRHTSKREHHLLLVAHGNIIRYLVCKALGIDGALWRRFDIQQCSLTRIEIDEHGFSRLLSFAEIGHVPVKKRTFL